MNRPRLTRKKIDSLLTAVWTAESHYEGVDEDEVNKDEVRDIKEASDFVSALSRWHRFKQTKGKTND